MVNPLINYNVKVFQQKHNLSSPIAGHIGSNPQFVGVSNQTKASSFKVFSFSVDGSVAPSFVNLISKYTSLSLTPPDLGITLSDFYISNTSPSPLIHISAQPGQTRVFFNLPVPCSLTINQDYLDMIVSPDETKVLIFYKGRLGGDEIPIVCPITVTQQGLVSFPKGNFISKTQKLFRTTWSFCKPHHTRFQSRLQHFF
jgi:hypothetical protein